MYVNEIASAASEMSGVAAEELMLFAAAADAEIASRIRSDADTEAGHTAIVTAGAFIALSLHQTAQGLSDITSYSAGEVTVTRNSSNSGKSAESLRNAAEFFLAPYISDPGFAFRSVNG